MRIETLTPPAADPLIVADAKLFCRIDPDLTDEDTLIGELITAAREQVEVQTGRALTPQTLRLVLDCFPRGPLPLPRFPLISVDSVVYDDAAGAEQTMAAADYDVVTASLPGAIHAPGGWPATIRRPGSVRITFQAGYGNDDPATEATPERAITAMKYLVNHWYENRDAVIVGSIATVLPMAVQNLIAPLKIYYRVPE